MQRLASCGVLDAPKNSRISSYDEALASLVRIIVKDYEGDTVEFYKQNSPPSVQKNTNPEKVDLNKDQERK